MQEGSFYCYARSPALGSWLLSRTKSEKLVHQKLDSVLSSWEDDSSIPDNHEGISLPSSLSRQGSLASTQSYVYRNAGLTVKVGLEEVASDLFRVKPFVYNAPDNSAVIVFSGCLQNLSELTCRKARSPRAADMNNALSLERRNSDPLSLERKSSIERSRDLGTLTASTVLGMYLDGQQEGNELIMLSELQGEYSFVIYDEKRKQAFAARDPSGEEPLYYHIGEDGSVSFASNRLAVPDGEQPHEWRELPPGHFISGKQPKLHQFALTPKQLVMRELEQEEELDTPTSARRRSLALEPDDAQLGNRTSMDNDKLVKRKSLDADVFTLDL